MLDKLLELGLIAHSQSKHPKEVRITDNPKYCKYHTIISHPIEKCKAFQKQVVQLMKEGSITLDEEDIKESYRSPLKIILKMFYQKDPLKLALMGRRPSHHCKF